MSKLARKESQSQQKSSANFTRSKVTGHDPNRVLNLQRTIGNQAIVRLLQARADDARPVTIQRKLAVNTPGDTYEQEADRIADRALTTSIHSSIAGAALHVQRFSPQSNGQESAPASVEHVLANAGRPLEPALRQDFEQRFGHDFNHVRIHTDAQAATSARSVYARAYTAGSHIVFGAGEFAPGTQKGSKLLAHELAHTIQQCGGSEGAHGSQLSTAPPASAAGLARAPVPIDAYPDDMLASRLAELRKRLKEKSYPDRDQDLDLQRVLTREVEKRARAVAVKEAQAYFESTEPPKEERYTMPARFLPGGFTDADINADLKQKEIDEKKRKEQEALNRKREEQGRPARLAIARRYFKLHGVSRGNAADVLTHFLTVNDLRVLRKNGLEPPGSLTLHYGDKVIAVIDKIVPRDQLEDREDAADLQRRAANIEHVSEKIEGLASEGPHALGGRIVGATTAYIAGKDPLAGSEVGAAFGGLLGARREMRYGMPSLTSSEHEPARPQIVDVEIAPLHETVPPPTTKEPLSPGKPNLTFNRGTDVTRSGQFPVAEPQPSVAPRRRETVADFQKRGGKITSVPEGQSGTPNTPTRVKPDPTTARPTGSRSASDADVVSQRGMHQQHRAYPSTPQHHVFPQELESWFKERFKGTGENIHEYTVFISEGEHQAIHKAGKGSVVKGVQEPDLKGWNQEWKDFKQNNPNASPQAIFEKAGQLMDKYKISAAEIARYKGKK
jgi:hypothetical protein